MPTQTDLVNAAYADITVSAAAPSTEDAAAISARVTPVVADLIARRVVTAVNTAAIADNQFPDLVRVLSERVAPIFGRPTNVEALAVAEARLRQITRLDRTQGTALVRAVLERLEALGAGSDAIDVTAVAARVQPVLDDIKARRIVNFANEAAVTSAYLNHIVTLVTATSKPGLIPDALVAEAEVSLREAARLDRSLGTPLVRAAMERLESVGAGSDAIDIDAVAARVQPVLDDLAARRVVTLANEAAVTSAYFTHVAFLIAADSRPGAVPAPLVAGAEAALREAARLNRTQSTPLVRMVLEQLQVYGAGDNPFDATAISARLPGMLAELAKRNIAYIADADNVEEEFSPWLVQYIAASLSSPQLYEVMTFAERKMKFISRINAAPTEPVCVEYF